MKVKKYRADDRSAALKRIRDELGPEAMIVSEARVRPGFFGLFGRPQVEILAAVEEDGSDEPAGTSAPPSNGVNMTISAAARQAAAAGGASEPATSRGRPAQPGGLSDEGASKLAAILESFPKNGQPVPPALAGSLQDLIARATAGEQVVPPSAAAAKKPAGVSRPAHTPPAVTPSDGNGGGLATVQQSLQELSTVVQRLAEQQQVSQLPREAPAVRIVYQQLIQQEVDPGLALDLAGQLSDEIGLNTWIEQDHVTGRLLDLLETRLSAGAVRLPDAEPSPLSASPTVVVLVGPTGVGKTTTLAKLASHYAVTEGRRVALVTTDTFRIAAAAQLGTYAEILELPLEVVYRPEDVPAAIGRHTDADVVLVDTPGCGQQDSGKLAELVSFVRAAQQAAPDATVLLTLAAPTKLRDLLHVHESFGAGSELPVHGYVFTKLDETTAFGPLVSLAVRTSRPVYFLTTGQKVPADFEPASPRRVAALLMHGIEPLDRRAEP